VSPPEGCHPGRSAPRPLVTPLVLTLAEAKPEISKWMGFQRKFYLLKYVHFYNNVCNFYNKILINAFDMLSTFIILINVNEMKVLWNS